jgi:hypothetical protein
MNKVLTIAQKLRDRLPSAAPRDQLGSSGGKTTDTPAPQSGMNENHISRLGFLLRCGVDVRYRNAHGDLHTIKALIPTYDPGDGTPPGPAIHLHDAGATVFIGDTHRDSFVQLVPASSGEGVSLVPALWD